MIEARSPISHGPRLIGTLPVARGAQNYFLGELNDATCIGATSALYYHISQRFQRQSTKALPRLNSLPLARGLINSVALFKAHYVAAASFVLFASLSSKGIHYRRPLLRKFEGAGLKQEELDGREEASAEKLTAVGAAFGVVAAATCTTKSGYWPDLKSFGDRFLPPKVVPMGLGTVCLCAGSFNAIGWAANRWALLTSKASPEAQE